MAKKVSDLIVERLIECGVDAMFGLPGGDMQFSLSGSLATMANGLSYSIGAAVAYRGRQVVCVVACVEGGATQTGPTVVHALVDPNEPPMTGKATTHQAIQLAKALLHGQKDAANVIETIAEDQIREVV
jgi:hypothetical protein